MKMRTTVLAVLMAVAPQTRAAINRALRPHEFDLVWAADASEAVEASVRRRPDLVLLDLNQPSQSTWGDFERLRAANPDAPVIVLAERGATHDRRLADRQVAVVEKPFGAAALADAVNALLNSSPGSGTSSYRPAAGIQSAHTEAGRFRESLLVRRDAPLALAPSYRHWGINE